MFSMGLRDNNIQLLSKSIRKVQPCNYLNTINISINSIQQQIMKEHNIQQHHYLECKFVFMYVHTDMIVIISYYILAYSIKRERIVGLPHYTLLSWWDK